MSWLNAMLSSMVCSIVLTSLFVDRAAMALVKVIDIINPGLVAVLPHMSHGLHRQRYLAKIARVFPVIYMWACSGCRTAECMSLKAVVYAGATVPPVMRVVKFSKTILQASKVAENNIGHGK